MSRKAYEIWPKVRLHNDMATFQALQARIGYVAMFEKLPYPLLTSILVILNMLPHITKVFKHR